MPTPSMTPSPLTTPGGRSLGRGLDDSPAISGTSANSQSAGAFDSPALVVSALLPSSRNLFSALWFEHVGARSRVQHN